MIEPGSPAPDFTLPDQDGNKVSLGDFRGRTVVLVFYPSDFSPVCTDQLSVYQEVLPQFEERDTVLVGISVDGAFCHKAFQQQLNTTIPLLAAKLREYSGNISRVADAIGVSRQLVYRLVDRYDLRGGSKE